MLVMTEATIWKGRRRALIGEGEVDSLMTASGSEIVSLDHVCGFYECKLKGMSMKLIKTSHVWSIEAVKPRRSGLL